MYKTITQFAAIVEFAKKFAAANKFDKFVPAYADFTTKKKPACKGFIDYEEENAITAANLIEFQTMTCLGVRLGNDYVVFDLDGKNAVALFKQLEERLGALPKTFHNGSLPGDREAVWLKIPERWHDKFSYVNLAPDGDHKLEVRSGKCHQVACGVHPVNGAYKQISDTIIIAELPEKWCLYIAGKMAQAAIDSGAVTVETTNGNGKKQYNNEGKLDQAVAMLDFLLSAGHPLGSDFSYNNRFRVGCALNSIDDSDAGLEAWLNWCRKETGYEDVDIAGLIPHWKSIKQDKHRGVTFGTIIAAFNSAYAAAKRDPELSGIVEQNKALHSHTTTAKQEITEFFDSVHYLINSGETFDQNNAFLQYSFANHITPEKLESYWNTWEASRSYDKAAQDKALARELKDFSIDVENIFAVLPGGKEVKETLLSRNYELIIGLMIWLATISALVPKKRFYQFADDPTGSGIFLSIIAESGKGKSPLIKIFTKPLKILDDANRAIDKANMKEFKRFEYEFKDTTKGERCNLNIPTKFGGKGTLKEQAEQRERDAKAHTGNAKTDPENELFAVDNVPLENDDNGEIVSRPEPADEMRHFLYSEGSPEAFRNLNAQQEFDRILWVVDELPRIFNLLKSYNAGSDEGDNSLLIAIMNEDEIKAKLVNELIYGQWGASLISGIQPHTLDKISFLDDKTGRTARFIFLDGTGIKIDHQHSKKSKQAACHDVLMELYQKMAKLPIGNCEVSAEIFEVWKDWDKKQVALSDIDTNLGYKFWLRKIGKNVLKIAGILQDWIYCDMQPGTYDPFIITDEVVLMAIQIGDYLVEYHRRLFKSYVSTESANETIDPELLEHQTYIMRYLAKRGASADMNTIRGTRHFKDKKINSVEVRKILETMSDRVKFEVGKGYSLI